MLFAKRKSQSGKLEDIVEASLAGDIDILTRDFVLMSGRVPKAPSKAAIFWSAFFDGPMGGLFGDAELPFAPTSMFKAPATESLADMYEEIISKITTNSPEEMTRSSQRIQEMVRLILRERLSERHLEEIFAKLDNSDLKRIKRAIHAAELAHAGHHETQ